MSKIIDDFLKTSQHRYGVGYFENDPLAAAFARTMGSNQRRKYKRHGIVPAAFIEYLKRTKALRQDVYVPERSRTVKVLLDLLWDAPDRDRGAYSEGEMLREALLFEILPELRRSTGSAQWIWRKLEQRTRILFMKNR